MVQKPIFSNSELYCIEEAVKTDLERFNKMKHSHLDKESENEIRDEYTNILNLLKEWREEEHICFTAFRNLTQTIISKP